MACSATAELQSCVVTPPCSSEGLKTRFEFLVVVLLKIQVFWDVKLCRTINSADVSTERCVFIFTVKPIDRQHGALKDLNL